MALRIFAAKNIGQYLAWAIGQLHSPVAHRIRLGSRKGAGLGSSGIVGGACTWPVSPEGGGIRAAESCGKVKTVSSKFFL